MSMTVWDLLTGALFYRKRMHKEKRVFNSLDCIVNIMIQKTTRKTKFNSLTSACKLCNYKSYCAMSGTWMNIRNYVK